MVSHDLLEDEAILVVEPKSALVAAAFESIARAVDPYIKTRGDFRGLLIQVEVFPGRRDFGGRVSHLRFVRDHHAHIKKVAAVTDSAFGVIAPSLAKHFVSAEVRHFVFDDHDASMACLGEG